MKNGVPEHIAKSFEKVQFEEISNQSIKDYSEEIVKTYILDSK